MSNNVITKQRISVEVPLGFHFLCNNERADLPSQASQNLIIIRDWPLSGRRRLTKHSRLPTHRLELAYIVFVHG